MNKSFVLSHLAIFGAILFSWAPACAQTQLQLRAGRIVGTAFLRVLTTPERTQYRVGIVNVSADTGMLVSPRGVSPVVEFIRGYNDWLWASAAKQLRSGQVETFRFEVIRKTIGAQTCPDLGDAVEAFYIGLDEALSSSISTSTLPQKPVPSEVTVDGTTFSIQISTEENYLALTPDRDINKSLQRAGDDLHRVVSSCANEAEGIIEDRYF